MTITLPPAVVDASASEKLVWVVLDESGPLSAAELAAQTGLSQSGVYNALGELRSRETVEKRRDPTDSYTHLFHTIQG
ncbi:MarR family transcriptional regulator [Halorarum salinum]|uniref:MarR family transcriptional regulator n=1 Tax=Halorarum salinum TaxID=2743089 RepID=A0A7D5LBT6_9EURY|nr:helix-turn-helix domain-containing protein [Halobaculum salinum]QLG62814.1 MarR family transcriptional regulator [Halobaculum salinum]